MNSPKRRVDCRFAGADANDAIAINQIMLRPIAPRPETAENSTMSMISKQNSITRKRTKRKYVRAKKKEVTECDLAINDGKISRFALDTSVRMHEASSENDFVATDPAPEWIGFGVSGNGVNKINNFTMMRNVITPVPDLHDVDLAMAARGGNVTESWITMESLTGACEVGNRVGYTDEEILKSLETDSCPCFISNCYDEVQWVNLAYRRIGDPNPDGGGPPPDVVVWLSINFDNLGLVKYWPAFSCRVRVVCQFLGKKLQMTVPCDVWKMDFGGFAWRLDVEAALSLGRRFN